MTEDDSIDVPGFNGLIKLTSRIWNDGSAVLSSPMRKELATQAGQRKKFRAVFNRLGKKTNYKGYSEETILLSDVREAGTLHLVTDHVWFSYTGGFEKLSLTQGCIIEFEARVKEYSKGYVNKRYGMDKRSVDYKLSYPTKIRKIDK